MSTAKAVTDDSFDADVLASPRPVIVEYWAPWCGPCRMVGPVLDEIAAQYAGKVDVVKLNTDENPQSMVKYGVLVPFSTIMTWRGYADDGMRLVRSVIRARRPLRAIHPTEKPVEVLRPLIEYACPPGGLVVAPFAGSGSDLDAARRSGRRAIGVEAREDYCERAALRLSQLILEAS